MGQFSAELSKPCLHVVYEKPKKPKGWERLRQRRPYGIGTLPDGSLVSTGTKPPPAQGAPQTGLSVSGGMVTASDHPILDLKKLPGFSVWKKTPKPAVYDQDAHDADGDGTVQDGTTQERPATPKAPKFIKPPHPPKGGMLAPPKPKTSSVPAAPKIYKVVPPKVVPTWDGPLLGKQMMDEPGVTSRALWDKHENRYVKQRRQLHAAIVQHFLDQAGKPKKGVTPTVYLLGGGPSSGKSTALASGALKIPKDAVRVDTDAIKEFLPEYRAWVTKGYVDSASLTQDESKHITALVTKALTDHGANVVYDTTGDGNYKGFVDRLEGLRANGHQVVAHYMTNDISLAQRLNAERFDKTGRMVPSYNVDYIHRQVSRVVPQALREGKFDQFYLYDTNNLKDGPRLIVEHQNGRTTYHDPAAWKTFLGKGVEPDKPKFNGPSGATSGQGSLFSSNPKFGNWKPKGADPLPPPKPESAPVGLPSPFAKAPPKDYTFYSGAHPLPPPTLPAPYTGPIGEPLKPRLPSPPPLQGDAQALANAAKGDWGKFHELLNQHGYTVIDYETTGFEHPNTNAPVQVGAVRVKDGKIVARFSSHMNPGEPLSDWSKNHLVDHTGAALTDTHLATQPPIKDVHQDLTKFIGDSIVVAHNMPFDRGVYQKAVDTNKIQHPLRGAIDTLELLRQIVPRGTETTRGPSGHTLGALADFFHVPNQDWHTADGDAATTAKILERALTFAEHTGAPKEPMNARWQADRYTAAMAKFKADQEQYIKDLAVYKGQSAAVAKQEAQAAKVVA